MVPGVPVTSKLEQAKKKRKKTCTFAAQAKYLAIRGWLSYYRFAVSHVIYIYSCRCPMDLADQQLSLTR